MKNKREGRERGKERKKKVPRLVDNKKTLHLCWCWGGFVFATPPTLSQQPSTKKDKSIRALNGGPFWPEITKKEIFFQLCGGVYME